MRTYAIANIKGGVGKTTVAVNLAAGLALAERRTLLLDLDPQASSTYHLHPNSNGGNLADCLASERKLTDILHETVISGLRLAPGHRMLAPFDNGVHPTRDRLTQLLRQAPEEIDYLFIDTPPTWGSLLVATLSSVDAVLIPIATRELDLRMLAILEEVIEQVRRHRNPRLRVAGIIPNRIVRTRLSRSVEDQLRERYGGIVYPGIRENARLAESGGLHAPIQISAPSSSGASDFGEVTRTFLEREERPL
jgi:chromosome partitioning protein